MSESFIAMENEFIGWEDWFDFKSECPSVFADLEKLKKIKIQEKILIKTIEKKFKTWRRKYD